MTSEKTNPISLFLCGDVMTGRGIDQVLPHPGNPVLHEPSVADAREYVRLAERANGPIQRPAAFDYIWGDVLEDLQNAGTDATIVNLETSITVSDEYWPGKEVHYRMHPKNIACLTSLGIDCCCLANNHVMDWGYMGLTETLQSLNAAGAAHAGAGENLAEAGAPAVIEVGRGRVLVFALGSTTSGVPWAWAAAEDRPGINLLEDLSEITAARIAATIRGFKQPRDVAVVSIHWGGNWGYDIPDEQRQFAHRLIEGGVDIVHGHSSHHIKAVEVYRNHLILYGCGDFLTDYEGIRGHERFRNDLTLMYLVKVDSRQGELLEAKLVPMQLRRFRLNYASEQDAKWLCDLLSRLGAPLGAKTQFMGQDADLAVRPHTIHLHWQ